MNPFINKAILLYSRQLLKETDISRKDPLTSQQNTFKELISHGRNTLFGKEHHFDNIFSFEDYWKNVPVRVYDDFVPYIERLRRGENYVLWDQKVKWFAKSSGTSSDKSKYIPITKDNLKNCHYSGFIKMLSTYISNYPKSKLLKGKALTLGGGVQLDELSTTGAMNGDLSAILLKNSPMLAELNRVPSKKTALISDFNTKIERICKECSHANITNFSGVPSWNLILLLKLLEYNKARYITELWPNLELFMHGGISFEPYRAQYEKIIPKLDMHYVENYNASEGYFAFQDDPTDRSMLLTLNNGVFFEFIPMNALEDVLSGKSKEVYTLEGVQTHKQYAVVISTNSGLWRYLIGDCVEFTSIFPHKIIISGRTQLYINAFGEELMINNAEKALSATCRKTGVSITEYTCAPIFMTKTNKGAHEWVVEFKGKASERLEEIQADDDSNNRPLMPMTAEDHEAFANILDEELRKQNSDYDAKRTNNATMRRLVLTPVPQGTFMKWMESKGKVGGQNKVPRLCNDRHYIDEIMKIL